MKVKAFKILDKTLGTLICLVLSLLKRLRRTPDAPAEPASILIVKLVALGDVVETLPAVRVIRRRFPQAHLAMMVTPRVRDVVEGSLDLDEIVYYDIFGKHAGLRGFFRLVQEMSKERSWDWVIELDQRYRITSILAYLLHPAKHVGFAIRGQGRQGLFDQKLPYRVDCPEAESFIDVAAAVGGNRSDGERVPIAYSEADAAAAESFLEESGVGPDDFIVLVNPGTSGIVRERQWPSDRFADTCDWLTHRYNARLVFAGAQENLPLIEEIRTKMKTSSILAAGRLTLKQFAALAERSQLMLSVDSGAQHIAAAMGTPIVGLFGPTDPAKWAPRGPQHRILHKGLECSPCVKPYLGQMPRCADPRCMTQITVEEVKAALREKMEELQPAREGAGA